MKRTLTVVVIGIAGGILALGAYVVFLLPGGLRAFLEKRTDFYQLYVYKTGEKFIDPSFRDLEGNQVHLSRYPHKAVLINFFASW